MSKIPEVGSFYSVCMQSNAYVLYVHVLYFALHDDDSFFLKHEKSQVLNTGRCLFLIHSFIQCSMRHALNLSHFVARYTRE